MTCAQIRDLFSARADDALTADERTTLDAHLATCAECRRDWQRFAATVGLLRAVEPARAPGGFVDRVLAATPRRPWYARLARGLFVPWPVKIPVQAAAVVLIGGLAVMIFRHSPDLQGAARAPEAPPRADRVQGYSSSERDQVKAETPAADDRFRVHGMTPERTPETAGNTPHARETPPPAPARPGAAPSSGMKDAARAAEAEQAAVPRSPAPVESRDARAPADAGRSQAEPPRIAQQQAEEPIAARRQQAPVQGVTPSEAPAARAAQPRGDAAGEARAKSSELLGGSAAGKDFGERRSEVQSLAAVKRSAVEVRLTVGDRSAATREITAIVSRLGGTVLPGRADTGALDVAVPRGGYPTLAHELARLGTTTVVRQPAEVGDTILVTITFTE